MKKIVIRDESDRDTIIQSNQYKAKKDFNLSSLGVKPLSCAVGIVKQVYSDQNRADVEVNGFTLPRIDVRSLEWVTPDDITTPTFITGERDLPPKNAKVMVIFPNGTLDSAFVLCSVFDPMQKKQDADFLVAGEERTYLKINEQKWTITYDKDSGDYIWSSDSDDTNTITININRTDEYVKIQVGDHLIHIDKKNGKVIMDAGGTSITLDGTTPEITIEDGSNVIVMDATGVDINTGKLFVPV